MFFEAADNIKGWKAKSSNQTSYKIELGGASAMTAKQVRVGREGLMRSLFESKLCTLLHYCTTALLMYGLKRNRVAANAEHGIDWLPRNYTLYRHVLAYGY